MFSVLPLDQLDTHFMTSVHSAVLQSSTLTMWLCPPVLQGQYDKVEDFGKLNAVLEAKCVHSVGWTALYCISPRTAL
jgi:hypothetical protein